MRLTAPQRLVYDAEKTIGGSISVMCGVMTVEHVCPEELVVEAIREIYRTNDVLNLRLDETGEEPVLYQTPAESHDIPVLHVNDPAELEPIGHTAATTPFDLSGPLSDLKAVVYPGGYGIVLRIHHLLGDAWSISLIANQINRFITGKPSTRYSYSSYANEEEAYFSSKRYQRDSSYFLDCFDRHPGAALPSSFEDADYAAAMLRLQLPETTRNALSAAAEKNDLTEASLLFGLFALYYAKSRGCPDAFFLGMLVLGRVSEKDLNTVGMYVNTVPVIAEPDYDAPLDENVRRFADSVLSVFRHQRYNYSRLIRDLKIQRGFTGKLFDTMVNY